jgi:hypothetical protein
MVLPQDLVAIWARIKRLAGILPASRLKPYEPAAAEVP